MSPEQLQEEIHEEVQVIIDASILSISYQDAFNVCIIKRLAALINEK